MPEASSPSSTIPHFPHAAPPESPVADEATARLDSRDLTAQFRAVTQSEPLFLLGNRISRIELVSHSNVTYMVDAHGIWQLTDSNIQEQTERFTAQHSCPDDYVFCRMTSLGRLSLSETAHSEPELSPSPLLEGSRWFGRGTGRSLYVNGALLLKLITKTNGQLMPLQPAGAALESAVQDAVKRHCSSHELTASERQLRVVDEKVQQVLLDAKVKPQMPPAKRRQRLATSVLNTRIRIGGCGDVLKLSAQQPAAVKVEETPAVPDESVPGSSTKSRHRWFQVMVVILLVGVFLALAALVGLWVSMAEDGVSQPGQNYLNLENAITTYITKTVLFPAREVTDVLVNWAALDGEVPLLDSAYTVSGFTAAAAPAQILTSNVVSKRSHAEALVQYIIALMHTYSTVPWAGVGFEDGSMYAANRDENGNPVALIRDMQGLFTNSTCLGLYRVSNVDYSLGELYRNVSCAYDPRTRPWYTETLENRQNSWTEVYVDFNTGELVISAQAPLFVHSNSSASVVGVFLADCSLASISSYLSKELALAQDGVVYIYEHDERMIAASAGRVATVGEDGREQRIFVNQSVDSKIRESQEYLHSKVGDDIIGNAPFMSGGSAVHDEPMQLTIGFHDTTAIGINWLLTVMVPVSKYYGFIYENLWYTLGSVLATGFIVLLFVVPPLRRVPRQARENTLELESILHARKRMLQGLMCIAVICIFLYIFWLTATKSGVDETASDAMHEAARLIQATFSYRYSALAAGNNATSNLAKTGALVLSSGNAAANTSLDSHFIRQLELYQRYGSVQAVYVGFADTGNLLGATFYKGRALVMVRDQASTAGELVYYETTGSGGSQKRDVNREVVRFKEYDARARPWYKLGVAKGRINGTTTGVEGKTTAYKAASDPPRYLDSVVMSFYPNLNTTMAGVLSTDLNFDSVNQFLKSLVDNFFPDGTDVLVLENMAEVITSSYGDTVTYDSAGNLILSNATYFGDDAATRVVELLDEFGGMIDSQNTEHLHGTSILSYTRAVGLTSIYVATEITKQLQEWTILEIIPRGTYFEHYDNSANATFATLLASFTLLFFYTNLMFKLVRWTLVRNQIRYQMKTRLEALGDSQDTHGNYNVEEEGPLHGVDKTINELNVKAVQDQSAPVDDVEEATPTDITEVTVTPLQFESNSTSIAGATGAGSGADAHDMIPMKPIPAASAPPSPHSAPPSPSSSGTKLTSTLKSFDQHLMIGCTKPDVSDEDDIRCTSPNTTAGEWLRKVDRAFGGAFYSHPSTDPLSCTDQELTGLTHTRLAPLVARWKLECSDDQLLHAKLREQAVEYLYQTDAGYPVYDTAGIEAKLGTTHWQAQMLIRWVTPWFQRGINLVMILFLLVELFPHARKPLDITCALVISCDATVRFLRQYTANGFARTSSVIQLWSLVIYWILFIVAHDVSGVAKAFVIFSTFQDIQVALEVFVWAVGESKTVFFLLFCVLGQSAILMVLLFQNEYEDSPDLGSDASDFLNGAVAMFVYLTSGENWDDVVYPMYRVNKASSVFFIFFAIVGIYFLSSMVLAIFQMTFEQKQEAIQLVKHRRQVASLCCPFVLWSWNLDNPLEPTPLGMSDFVRLILQYWNKTSAHARLASVHKEETAHNAISRWKREVLQQIVVDTNAERNFGVMPRAIRNALGDDAKGTIFVSMDDDESGIVDAHEFQDIFAVTSCVDKIKENELLGWRVIAARWEIERDEIKHDQNSPPGRLDTVELMLANALHSGNEHMEILELDRRVLGVLRWRNLNKLMTLFFLVHSYFLTLLTSDKANSGALLDKDDIFTVSAVFCLLYPMEMILRIISVGGVQNFFRDKLFPHSFWSNVCQSVLTAWGLVFTLLYFTIPAEHSRLCQAFMSISLWRIFFVTPSFANLLYSLYHGLQAISVYVKLLLLVGYTFSFAAWKMFEGDLDDTAVNFNTLGDSMLTMFQIFVGEVASKQIAKHAATSLMGWQSIMQAAVAQTNTALLWFFALYVLVVSMLFSNLFFGIIITLFQEIETTRTTSSGTIDLIFYWQMLGMDRAEKKWFIKKLGFLSSLLYAPALKSVAGLLVLTHKYRAEIEAHGANMELWAAVRIQSAFQARRARKFTDALKTIRLALDSPSSTISYSDFMKRGEATWLRHEERIDAAVSRSAAKELASEFAAELSVTVESWRPFEERDMLRRPPPSSRNRGDAGRFGVGVWLCWVAPQMLPLLMSKDDSSIEQKEDRGAGQEALPTMGGTMTI